MIAGVLIASVVHLLMRRRELSFVRMAVLTVFLSCLLVDSIAFAFMNEMIGINGSYWLPVVPLAFAVLGIEGETFPLRRGLPRDVYKRHLHKVCIRPFSVTNASGSNPTKGSSRIRSRGSWIRAPRIASFCFIPWE